MKTTSPKAAITGTVGRKVSAKWLNAASLTALAVASALAPAGAPDRAAAQVVTANGATQVKAADNGVQVVNIAAPNAQGLSVNQYTTYSVSSSGLILNNAATGSGNAQGQVSTQLGGLINTNANLTVAAKAILNEVTSTNPTVLSGYTEVAGTRADVIVANPNGITCGGCGFINTAALTLTTGSANIDATGKLLGFNVVGGTITLNGAGLDAQTTDYAALLGRKITLSGPAYGTTLDVVAGANAWDYEAHTATAIAGTRAAPDYAIDSTAVGGMYANRIRLIATEAGVGVRLLGDAAATGDDLTITAAGDLILKGNVSAHRDLAVGTTASDAAAITQAGVNLTAGRDLSLSAAGGVNLTGGSLVAARNLSLTAGTLSDTADTTSTATNANQRYAGGAMTLKATGAATLNGVSYGASGDLNGQLGSLALAGGGYVYSNTGALSLTATAGDLSLGAYALSSAGDLSLTASKGAVSTAANDKQAVVSGGGAVSIRAANGLTNAGAIAANAGNVTLALGAASSNTGTITASGDIALTDGAGGASGSLTNAAGAKLIAGGTLAAKLSALSNAGAIQAAKGTQLTAGSLTNSGLLIASTDAASDGVLSVGTLANSGTLQSARDLTLHDSTSLTNSGAIVSVGVLTIDGGAATSNTSSGVISAATITATLASLTNAGQVVGGGDLTLTVSGDLANTGSLGAGGALTAGSVTLENTGAAAMIQSQAGGALTVTGALDNSGAIYLANASGDATVSAATLANQTGAVLVSQGDLSLTLSGATLDNAGEIIAAGSLAVDGTGAALTVDNGAGAYLQAGGAAGDSLTIAGKAVILDTAAGSVTTGGDVSLTLAAMNNTGSLSATRGLTFTATGAATNAGALVSGGALKGRAASLTNAAGGGIQGTAGVALAVTGALENDGTILTPAASGADLTLAAGTLVNAKGAYLQADRALGVTLSGPTLSNAGVISSSAALTIHETGAALAFTNAGTGVISAAGPTGGAAATLTVDGGAVSLTNEPGGQIVGDHLALSLASLENDGALGANVGSNTLAVTGALTNTGTLVITADSAGAGAISAASLANSGTLASNGGLALTLGTGLNNAGVVQSVGALSVGFGSGAASLQNTGSEAQILAGGALSVTGANTTLTSSGELSGASVSLTLAALNNAGRLVSNGNVGVTASGAVGNTGVLASGGTLTLAAASLTNGAAGTSSAVIQSDVSGAITLTGALTDAGAIYLGNTSGAGTVKASVIDVLAGGSLVSQGALTLNLTGASLDNAGLIYAGNDLGINATGALAITNEDTGAIETAAPAAGVTGRILITGSNVSLANQAGIVNGKAASGVIVGNDLAWNLAGFDNEGQLQSRGAFSLTSASAARNGGVLYAQGGAVTINTAGFINAAGAIVQGDTGASLTLAGDLSNAGTLLASTNGSGTLTIKAGALTNAATGVVQADGGTSLTLIGALNNAGVLIASTNGTGALAVTAASFTGAAGSAIQADAGANFGLGKGAFTNDGTLVASTKGAGTFTVTAGKFDNQAAGVIQSGAGTTLSLSGDFDNEGKLIGATAGSGATNISAASIDNAAGAVLQSAAGANLTAAGAFTNGGVVLTSVDGQGALVINAASLTNQSGATLQSDTGATVTLTGDFSNAGVVVGSTNGTGSLTIKAGNFGNAAGATVQADDGLTLKLTGALSNAGALIASTNGLGALTVTAGKFQNLAGGGVQAGSGTSLTLSGAFDNAGTLIASTNGTGALAMTATGFTNAAGAAIQADDGVTVGLGGGAFSNAGLLIASTKGAGAFKVTADQFTNAKGGTIQSDAAASLTLGGAFDNAGTLIGSTAGTAAMTLSAASIQNDAGGIVQSAAGETLTTAGAVTNAGTMLNSLDGSGILAITAASLTNQAGGVLQSDTGATLSLAGAFGNAGVLIGSTNGTGALIINATNFSNLAPGATPAAATVQSSGALTVNLTASTFTNTGDVISLGDMAIHDPGAALTVSNSAGGIIVAQSGTPAPAVLTIDGQATSLSNGANSAIAGDGMTLTLNGTAGLNNAGKLVIGSGADSITVQNTFANSGVFYTAGHSDIQADSITNAAGAVFEPNDVSATIQTAFTNTGLVYVPGSLGIYVYNNTSRQVSVSNTAGGGHANDGLMQVGGSLSLNGNRVNFTNGSGATVVVGSGFSTIAEGVDNAGMIQAGSMNLGAFSYVADVGSGAVVNETGATLATTGGQLDFNAGKVTNAGLWSANGGIQILSSGDVHFTSTGRSLSVDFLDLAGASLTLDNGASITTSTDFDINVGALTLGGGSARIISLSPGAVSTLGVGSTFVNPGAIYSAGGLNLTISSGELFNNATGAIIAGLGDLSITTPQYITNAGEIYAGGALTLKDANQIWNQASTTAASATTTAQGDIEAGGAMTITTGTLYNSSNIIAGGDITINATNLWNAVAGDWSRHYSSTTGTPYNNFTSLAVAEPGCVTKNGQCTYDTDVFYIWSDTTTQTFNNGLTAANYTPEMVSGGTITLNGFQNASNAGAIMSAPNIVLHGGNNATFSEDTLSLTNTETDYAYYTVTTETKTYNKSGALVLDATVVGTAKNCTPGVTGTICGNGVSSYFTSTSANSPLKNGIFASSLTGNNFSLTVTGSPGGATLKSQTAPSAGGGAGAATTTSATSASVSASGAGGASATGTAGGLSSSGGVAGASATAGATTTSGASGTSGVSGTTASAGGAVTGGSVTTVSTGGTSAGSASGVSSSGGTSVSSPAVGTTVGGKPAVTIQGATVVLPTNPNGLFVIAPSSDSRYLVETNPLYTVPVTDLGSDLLAQKLGFDPDTAGKRLGDDNYEAYLISQQLLDATGRSLLASYGDLNSELAELYGNAASDAGAQGLVYGQALTPQQVASLPNDIIWMVKTEVDGQTVLAPVVYLSSATKASLVSGSGVIADNVNLQLTSLTLNGGQITGAKTNAIVATGDINNLGGGLISGNQVYLQSTGGVVNNIRSTIQGVQSAAVLANGQITNAGGVIAADNIGLRSATAGVDLQGGTVAAGDALSIDVAKDIDINGSNNISGKNLSLTTHGGSINVVTGTTTLVNGKTVVTDIGPTAAITATESLSLNAAKDINVKGGTVSAGKDLSIVAGQNINIGTITDTEASASSSRDGSTSTKSYETRTTNIGSTVSAGGNLYMQSGGDTTITGSKVSAGGDAAFVSGGQLNIKAATDTSYSDTTVHHSGFLSSSNKETKVTTATDSASQVTVGGSTYMQTNGDINIAGGSSVTTGSNLVTDTNGHDLNIIAGNNATTTNTVSKSSGLFQNGGLWGSSTKTVNDAETRNDASSLKVGGQISSANNANVTIKGSNVDVAGGGVIAATNGVSVLAGADTSNITSHTETETILGVSSHSSGSASASATASAKKTSTGGTVNAQASAQASGENHSSLEFYNKTVTDSASSSSENVASNVNLGGNTMISGGGNVVIQGSNVTTTNGADLTIHGKNVSILAGQNTETSTTTTKSTGVGIYVDTEGSVSASASASASGGASKSGVSFGAQAQASADAKGSVTATIGGRTTTTHDTTDKLTNVGSNVTADGALTIVADDTLTTQGSNLTVTNGALTEQATHIANLAAQDHDVTTHSQTQTTAGLYAKVGAEIGATASAGASASLTSEGVTQQIGQAGSPGKIGVAAGAAVQLEAAGGFRVQSDTESSVDASTHAVGSTLTAGGGINRIAGDTITDQGTQLKAGGDIMQSAKTITDQAVADTELHSKSSSTTTFEIGAVANAGISVGNGTDSQTGAGIKAGGGYGSSAETEKSSKAVVTTYTAGGTVTSVSSGKTTLAGATINGQNGVTLQAGSLDYQAAQNTESKSGLDRTVEGSVTVDILGKTVNPNLKYEQGSENASTIEGVGGQVQSANGAVNITTTNGDLNLTGTQVDGAAGVTVAAVNGTTHLGAAQTITHDTNQEIGVDVDLTIGKGGKKQKKGVDGNSADIGASGQTDTETSVKNQVVTLNAGAGQTTVTGQHVVSDGAQIHGETGATVVATAGPVQLNSVTDKTMSQSTGANVALGVEKSKKAVDTSFAEGFNATRSTEQEETATTITSGTGVVAVGQGPSPIQPQLLGTMNAPTTGALPQSVGATAVAIQNPAGSAIFNGLATPNAAGANGPTATGVHQGVATVTPLSGVAGPATGVPVSVQAAGASPLTGIAPLTGVVQSVGAAAHPVAPAAGVGAVSPIGAQATAQAVTAPAAAGAIVAPQVKAVGALTTNSAPPPIVVAGGAATVTKAGALTGGQGGVAAETPTYTETHQATVTGTQVAQNTLGKPVIQAQGTSTSTSTTNHGDDHTRSDDHTKSDDHSKSGGDTSTGGGDHTKSGGDTSTGGGDHTKSGGDTSTGGDDHTKSGGETSTGGGDHNKLGGDTTTGGGDHTKSGGDTSTGGDDHTKSGGDNSTGDGDHTRSGGDDHTESGEDTSTGGDHTQSDKGGQTTSSIPPVITAGGTGGQPLPCWMTIDPRTGAISGHPSNADAKANVPVIVIEQVPQPDGTIRTLRFTVKPTQFGAGGSQCNIIRTNPTSRGGDAGGQSRKAPDPR